MFGWGMENSNTGLGPRKAHSLVPLLWFLFAYVDSSTEEFASLRLLVTGEFASESLMSKAQGRVVS